MTSLPPAPSALNVRRPPRPRPPVAFELTAPIGTDGPDGRLLISVGRTSGLYWLAELPCDFPGRAFRLTRFGHTEGEERGDYHVHVGTPAESSCTCPDATFRHRPEGCKHLQACRALAEAGRI
jgi:hypothetical protein